MRGGSDGTDEERVEIEAALDREAAREGGMGQSPRQLTSQQLLWRLLWRMWKLPSAG